MSNADDEQQHNSSQYSQHQDGARRIMVVPEESNTFDSGRLIGGQNHNLSGHAGWGIGTPTENVELGGQRNYQMVQQNNLRQQLAAFQLSLLGQRAPTSGPPQSQGATSLQHHGDILAAHANRQLPLNTLQYLGLQHLSSSLGLQSLAAQLQQLQGIPQGAQYQSMVVPHQVPNEYTANLQSSSLNDHLPVTQNQNAGEGASVVPCRARAMPQDHNAQTAYFVIPKNIKHGDGLQCSHVQCQNKGIRFVYCKVCYVPVAKINFATRHKHEEVKDGATPKTSGKKRFRYE